MRISSLSLQEPKHISKDFTMLYVAVVSSKVPTAARSVGGS